MLARFEVQHYKSLYDVKVDLEPLTVFIGPNGSGKSNICESLAVLSKLLEIIFRDQDSIPRTGIERAIQEVANNSNSESKFWHGVVDYLVWGMSSQDALINNSAVTQPELSIRLNCLEQTFLIGSAHSSRQIVSTNSARNFLVHSNYLHTSLANALRSVKVYDFAPINLASNSDPSNMTRAGDGLASSLVDILHSNRDGFDELEERFRRLVPNIKRIVLPRNDSQNFTLELVDKFSDHHIPASDISDGTLRILAFLTAIYQDRTPSILCFEELENGVHPWLLHKMMELLKIVSTEGVTGKPVQVIITTHSPVLLNYVEPHQVRAVELDAEGKTQIHALPTETTRFQKAMEAYDGALGELWFTGIFGGNPA
jgi:ABC-type branched-subunit amino acid transport system ATPase component